MIKERIIFKIIIRYSLHDDQSHVRLLNIPIACQFDIAIFEKVFEPIFEPFLFEFVEHIISLVF